MSRPRQTIPTTLEELYQRAVWIPQNGCRVWGGRMVWNGYGQIGIGRQHAADLGMPQTILVHRLAWLLANGPIPEGMQIDHRCFNRACINVEHMELVTSAENTRRGLGPKLSAIRMKKIRMRHELKTHCPKGHEYTLENTYTDKRGIRTCRTCQRARSTTWKQQNPGWRKKRHDGDTPL